SVRNLDNASDRARAIDMDHLQEGLRVVERQLALADIKRPALATEDQEAIESLPVAQLPGEAAGAVADLVGTKHFLVLWSRAGLTPAAYVCNARHDDGHLLSRGVDLRTCQIWRDRVEDAGSRTRSARFECDNPRPPAPLGQSLEVGRVVPNRGPHPPKSRAKDGEAETKKAPATKYSSGRPRGV